MKTLGLIGGTSWVSTLDYYRYINEGINRNTEGVDFARCYIYSFNHTDIVRYHKEQNIEGAMAELLTACRNLERSGAEGLIICANTMHRFYDELVPQLSIPVIHIADATAEAIQAAGLKKVALLGTIFTMEMDFIKDRIISKGIEILVPEKTDREFIHQSIATELCRDIFTAATKERYLKIISQLIAEGAEGVILGCTEIPLLIKEGDVNIPLFDTALIHAEAAVKFALSE